MTSIADDVLLDKQALGLSVAKLVEDKRVKEIQDMTKEDPALRRYAARQMRNPIVHKNVMGLSTSEKRALKRQLDNADNTRQTTGVKCVLLAQNGKVKQVFVPIGEKYDEMQIMYIDGGLTLLYKTEGGKVNRKASQLAGKQLYADVYVCKSNQEDYLVSEYESK